LGLDRVRSVAQRLELLPPAAITLMIAGTNGKGSSATLASDFYRAAGYLVGCYTSPHLLRYNERIAIDGVPVADAELCSAFAQIEQARGEIQLTYFEFGTLAALLLLRAAAVEIQVLEVGLGGRLDAVNIVDADCAIVTNIGLDHLDWLGSDVEQIGTEKAGIFRSHRPAVCVQRGPPASVLRTAAEIGAPLALLGRDYQASLNDDGRTWHWRHSRGMSYAQLPLPRLAGRAQLDNAAGVLAAVEALQSRLPVAEKAIHRALSELHLRGRYERIGRVIFDVAHNAEAAAVLAENLRADSDANHVLLVLGMLADKPVAAVCSLLKPRVEQAFFGSLPPPRGLTDQRLRELASQGGMNGIAAGSIEQAFEQAWRAAGAEDIVLVCGSFLSVAAIAQLEGKFGNFA
jgi:dihydrofolate synthase/folylpolyglutamate synthase